MEFNRKIVLEDGSEYFGYGFGGHSERICEIVFNTAMVGYQEVVSDTSYTHCMVVMTYPVIGNYGIADDDFERKTPTIGGLIVREYNDNPSNFRYTKTLSEILEENDIPGIYGVDTRMLTRSIRDNGCGKVIMTGIETTREEALERLRNSEIPKDIVSVLSCKKRWYSRTSNHKYNVVVIDCGVKLNMIRYLNNLGCNVTVMPFSVSAKEIEDIKPDGVLISGGSGDPQNAESVTELIREIKGQYPIIGICLGYQLICLAYGAKTYKMKIGHRGGNHPIKNLKTGKIEIAGQNHGYAVDKESVGSTELEITHVNLLDGTVEGVECESERVIGVQYYPEITPGTQNSSYPFDRFIVRMMEARNDA